MKSVIHTILGLALACVCAVADEAATDNSPADERVSSGLKKEDEKKGSGCKDYSRLLRFAAPDKL